MAFRLLNQPDLLLEFVIDTGFIGDLTLPPVAIAALGLPFVYSQAVTLANDSDVEIPVYQALIIWQGSERSVHVLATGNRPLLGTALLAGYNFSVQFIENGFVTVNADYR